MWKLISDARRELHLYLQKRNRISQITQQRKYAKLHDNHSLQVHKLIPHKRVLETVTVAALVKKFIEFYRPPD